MSAQIRSDTSSQTLKYDCYKDKGSDNLSSISDTKLPLKESDIVDKVACVIMLSLLLLPEEAEQNCKSVVNFKLACIHNKLYNIVSARRTVGKKQAQQIVFKKIFVQNPVFPVLPFRMALIKRKSSFDDFLHLNCRDAEGYCPAAKYRLMKPVF